MLNKVWFALLLVGILYGFGRSTYNDVNRRSQSLVATPPSENAAGDASAANRESTSPPGLAQMGKDLNEAALSAAKLSVEFCIGLIGVMALWLGLLNVARDAGLVDALARVLRPPMRWLFPDVPDGHPAQGAMLMNLSANVLGLDNAATPMGLKAMKELQTLNTSDDTATNSMVMFLAINTSSVTLIPFSIIGYRAIAESASPAGPMLGILLTTSVATVAAIVAARLLQRVPAFAATQPDAPESVSPANASYRAPDSGGAVEPPSQDSP